MSNLLQVQVEGLLEFLEHHGDQMRELLLTHGLKTDRLLAAITVR